LPGARLCGRYHHSALVGGEIPAACSYRSCAGCHRTVAPFAGSLVDLRRRCAVYSCTRACALPLRLYAAKRCCAATHHCLARVGTTQDCIIGFDATTMAAFMGSVHSYGAGLLLRLCHCCLTFLLLPVILPGALVALVAGGMFLLTLHHYAGAVCLHTAAYIALHAHHLHASPCHHPIPISYSSASLPVTILVRCMVVRVRCWQRLPAAHYALLLWFWRRHAGLGRDMCSATPATSLFSSLSESIHWRELRVRVACRVVYINAAYSTMYIHYTHYPLPRCLISAAAFCLPYGVVLLCSGASLRGSCGWQTTVVLFAINATAATCCQR